VKGDYEGSYKLSRRARFCTKWSILLGTIYTILLIVILVVNIYVVRENVAAAEKAMVQQQQQQEQVQQAIAIIQKEIQQLATLHQQQ